MTKHIYRIASGLQETLLGAAMLYPPDEWPHHVPRVHLDAWATLYRWHAEGERIWRVTEQEEAWMLDHPLPARLPLIDAPVRAEALAVQLPDRSEWVVIARHATAPVTIPVHGDVRFGYTQPLLTYCSPGSRTDDGSLGSGFVNLIDQPEYGSIRLIAGTLTGEQDAAERQLTKDELGMDAYRLLVGINASVAPSHPDR